MRLFLTHSFESGLWKCLCMRLVRMQGRYRWMQKKRRAPVQALLPNVPIFDIRLSLRVTFLDGLTRQPYIPGLNAGALRP